MRYQEERYDHCRPSEHSIINIQEKKFMFYFFASSRIWNDTFMYITHDTFRSIPPCNHVLVRFIYRLLAEYSLVWVRFNQGVTDSALNSATYNYFAYNFALNSSCRVGCGKFVRYTYFKIIQKLYHIHHYSKLVQRATSTLQVQTF